MENVINNFQINPITCFQLQALKKLNLKKVKTLKFSTNKYFVHKIPRECVTKVLRKVCVKYQSKPNDS